MAAAAPPGVDLFDEYFKRADLDRDGRISGTEAVAFFQGSNLPKPVLAQVWMHADQNRTGYLGRQEFYNALKLVTVAQSGRALTPDIVKSALYGPAAAKIPAPKMNPVSSPAPQFNPAAPPTPSTNSLLPPSNQFGPVAPNASLSLGTGATQAPQNVVNNQQAFLMANNNLVRPSQTGTASTVLSMQGSNSTLSGGGSLLGPNLPISGTSNLSSGLLGNKTSGVPVGGMPQAPLRGVTSSQFDGFGLALSGTSTGVSSNPNSQYGQAFSILLPKPVNQALPSSNPVNDPRSLVLAGNGISSDSFFGGDAFSTTQLKSNTNMLNVSPSNMPSSANIAPVTSGTQNLVRPGQLNSLQNNWSLTPGGNQLQPTQSTAKQNQLDSSRMSSALAVPSVSSGSVNSTSNQSQLQWPKITQSDIKKYTKVFLDVDKDKDGKITGEQARNLFLSWKLPREVLKQVWDLSDQDNDSMLSLREFCISLYLMERYREGHPLPNVLPSTLMYDETLLRATTLPSAGFGGPAWQPAGIPQQGFAGSGPVMPAAGGRPPMQNSVLLHTNGAVQLPPNSGVPGLENHNMNKLGRQNQNTYSKLQDAADAENKVQEVEKQILDSKEKIEFYRTKMQELVLYKSRCDNRLNEITERASGDRREVELLAKKYEEKYKQVGEVASKLAVEEAKFRDIQERKMELHNAIIKMEQGGSADGLLQVRVDRMQSDLEELEKAFIQRCKQHNLHVKETTLIELPSGWEPGPQDEALVWDENWDKFEDEGFTTVKDLTGDVVDTAATTSPMSTSILSDKASVYELYPIDEEDENSNGAKDQMNGSAYDHSEDGSTSIRSSPGRSGIESPFNTTGSGKHDTSPRTKERHSDQSGAESTVSGDKHYDESWTFDDADSVWGFNTNQTQEVDHFMSGELGSIKVDSPSASSVFGKEKKSSFFDDSVPTSPAFNSSPSIMFNDQRENSFSGSFATSDGLFPPRESRPDTFSRFDSMSSTRPDTFSRFDSMSSTQPETFSRIDSMSSTREYSRSRFDSFDDADPFGSTGPFKASGSHSPRRDSDNWRAF